MSSYNNVTGTFGGTLNLACNVTTDVIDSIYGWHKKSTGDKWKTLADKHKYGGFLKTNLTIKNVDTNDAGVYRCFSYNTKTKFVNYSSNISVMVPESPLVPPSTTTASTTITVPTTTKTIPTTTTTSPTTTTPTLTTTTSTSTNQSPTTTTPTTTTATTTTTTPTYTTTTPTTTTTTPTTTTTTPTTTTTTPTTTYLPPDIPLVYQSSDNIKASTGDTIQLNCVYKSYSEPYAVFWKLDGENLNISVTKYNGSTVNEPSLTIYNTELLDAGTYVCAVVNDIGTGYSNKIRVIITDQEKTGDDKLPIVLIVCGGIGGIVVFVAVFIICIILRRRRNSNQKETNERKENTELITNEQAVQYTPGRFSYTEPGEGESSTSILMESNQQIDGECNDMTMNHSSIKVNELEDYISKRHLNGVLEDDYKKIPYGNLHPTTKAQQKVNLQKNRFKTTFPYDHTRVVLEPGHGKSSDYINANYVDGFKKEKCYIASQGPLKNTINDHWRMIWQNDTRKIIMLTNLIEGTNTLSITKAKNERAAYITREIEVEDKTTKEKRCISQYHFTAWPDHGTPDPLYLVLFHKHVRSDLTSTENNGPLLVHCSAAGQYKIKVLQTDDDCMKSLRANFLTLESIKLKRKKKQHAEGHQLVFNYSDNSVLRKADKNRLFLSSYDKGRTDYINAVQAPSYTKFVGYLTTQLPLPDTKVDFWTMVRDHNSSTVVVFLNDAAEVDLVYSTSNDTFTCGKYSLDISRRKQEDLDVTSCKVVLSKKGDQSREIAMYLAVSNGLPNPQVLCKLVNCISTRVRMSNDPVTVVSGDGAKTCGVFCTFANAVSSMIIDKNANIFQLARLLQLRRPEFFADFEEYRLCYEALNVYLVSSNVYENF
ncbi:Hypothetical predicted protein [Mytilus galloprovincialis]|uniref:protein-tyrosine-phosphatase n=1 Tax=Mytilus galloprovincialis TaxID=29158 RepID=A0A8B6BSC3_MYTGA|nr:Hypothetical predicted protein [Mytilus galloprovincialis]